MTSSTTARGRMVREVAPRTVPPWTFGERLRKIRRHLGIGQQEFAEQLGENRKTYAAWELDTNSPRNVVAVARRIELMTGFSASWTLGLDDAAAAADVVTPNGGAGQPINRDCSSTAGQRHAPTPISVVAPADGSDDWAEWRTAS